MIKSITSILMVVLLTALGGCSSSEKKNHNEGRDTDLFNQAENAYKQKRYDEAQDLFLRTLKKNPKQYEAMYWLGNIAYRKNDFNEARKRYTQTLEINRNHAKAHHNLATVYLVLAEQHFKFFLTTTQDNQGNTSAVIKIMGDIDNFRRGGSDQPTDDGDDAAVEAIADEFAF